MGKLFMLYRCILMGGEQSESVEEVDAIDDADALLKSEILLTDRGYDSLELWLENRMAGYRSHADRIANNPYELGIFVACLVGIAAFLALTVAVIFGKV
jgi:hypothetical protein